MSALVSPTLRLSPATLHHLSPSVARPAYDRAGLRPGILHLGVGGFHRAHQAVYTDTALNLRGGNWGIVGVSLRSDTAANQLNPQAGLYTLRSEDAQGVNLRLIGAIQRIVVAPREPQVLDEIIADPAIKVITLTITEKGYCLGADNWSLDHKAWKIQQDLAHPLAATTAIGVLARGLRQRQLRSGSPLTIISCDNLSENSRRLQQALFSFVGEVWPDTLPWLQQSVAFPCSMVDRIVPSMSELSLARQAGLVGLRDEAAVATEPFMQWMIEDSFANGIPDWASAGAILVPDIQPYEIAKLRILNASHSAIAYLGLLMGKETVSDCMADPRLHQPVQALMTQELATAIDAPPGFDLQAYCRQLLQRFANPCLQHRCAQIAMDATEKIRQRWLPTLERLPGDSLLLRTLALWCHLVLRTDITIEDPRRAALMSLRASEASLSQRLEKLLDCLGVATPQAPDWQARIHQIEAYLHGLAQADPAGLLAVIRVNAADARDHQDQ